MRSLPAPASEQKAALQGVRFAAAQLPPPSVPSSASLQPQRPRPGSLNQSPAKPHAPVKPPQAADGPATAPPAPEAAELAAAEEAAAAAAALAARTRAAAAFASHACRNVSTSPNSPATPLQHTAAAKARAAATAPVVAVQVVAAPMNHAEQPSRWRRIQQRAATSLRGLLNRRRQQSSAHGVSTTAPVTAV